MFTTKRNEKDGQKEREAERAKHDDNILPTLWKCYEAIGAG